MLKRLIFQIVIGCSFFLHASCTTTPTPARLQAPSPTEVSIKTSLILDIPNETAAQLKIPPKLKGDLRITVNAEALENEPLRSHFFGNISIVFNDTVTSQKYLNFETTVEGYADGSPNEGMVEAFKRFFSAITLLNNSTSQFIPKSQN